MTTTVDYLLTGNPVEDASLGTARLCRRFQAVERFDEEDQETVIKLIDAMIAKQQMHPALQPIEEQAASH